MGAGSLKKNSRKNRENLRQKTGGFAMGNDGMLGTTCMNGQARRKVAGAEPACGRQAPLPNCRVFESRASAKERTGGAG